jgi:hypothetical protein
VRIQPNPRDRDSDLTSGRFPRGDPLAELKALASDLYGDARSDGARKSETLNAYTFPRLSIRTFCRIGAGGGGMLYRTKQWKKPEESSSGVKTPTENRMFSPGGTKTQ